MTANLTEALVDNSRQSNAVNAFLYEQMVNPGLARVIVDPSTATRFSGASHDYFQDWLSDDQKSAVSKAVSSNELFLIKGPPRHRQDVCDSRDCASDTQTRPGGSNSSHLPVYRCCRSCPHANSKCCRRLPSGDGQARALPTELATVGRVGLYLSAPAHGGKRCWTGANLS